MTKFWFEFDWLTIETVRFGPVRTINTHYSTLPLKRYPKLLAIPDRKVVETALLFQIVGNGTYLKRLNVNLDTGENAEESCFLLLRTGVRETDSRSLIMQRKFAKSRSTSG